MAFFQNVSLISIYIICTMLLVVQFHCQSGKLKLVIMLSFFLVDLLSGCGHYFLDHYTGNNNFAKPIAEEFQEHHDIPSGIVDVSILDMVDNWQCFGPSDYCLLYSTMYSTQTNILF